MIRLWWCRRLPAAALISVEQCERNHERAERAGRARGMVSHALRGGQRPIEAACVLVHLEACLGCPGVVALARRRGQRRADRVIDPRESVAPAAAEQGVPAEGGGRRRGGGEPNKRLARRWADR